MGNVRTFSTVGRNYGYRPTCIHGTLITNLAVCLQSSTTLSLTMAHTTRAAARAKEEPFADIERDDDLVEEPRNEGATQNDASSSDNDDVSVFFKNPVLAASYADNMEAIRQCSSSPANDDDTDDDSVYFKDPVQRAEYADAMKAIRQYSSSDDDSVPSKDPVWAAEYADDMQAIRQCSSSPDNADDDYDTDYDDDDFVSTQHHDPELAAKDLA